MSTACMDMEPDAGVKRLAASELNFQAVCMNSLCVIFMRMLSVSAISTSCRVCTADEIPWSGC